MIGWWVGDLERAEARVEAMQKVVDAVRARMQKWIRLYVEGGPGEYAEAGRIVLGMLDEVTGEYTNSQKEGGE